MGLLINLDLLLQVMSRRVRSSEDRKKAPAIVPSRVNSSSSDDDIVSINEQVMQTLQRRFDRGGDDTVALRGIHIAHHTRS